MPLWLTIVLALGGSALINAMVNFLFNHGTKAAKEHQQQLEDNRRDFMLLKEALQVLLRKELFAFWDKCSSRGYATENEKYQFEDIYAKYHGLGGNGIATNVRNDFMKLPTQPSNHYNDEN